MNMDEQKEQKWQKDNRWISTILSRKPKTSKEAYKIMHKFVGVSINKPDKGIRHCSQLSFIVEDHLMNTTEGGLDDKFKMSDKFRATRECMLDNLTATRGLIMLDKLAKGIK